MIREITPKRSTRQLSIAHNHMMGAAFFAWKQAAPKGLVVPHNHTMGAAYFSWSRS